VVGERRYDSTLVNHSSNLSVGTQLLLRMKIGIFSECYHPIANGVVASIDALCDGLRAAGHDAFVVAPSGRSAVCVPSLPLPTRTAYRLVLPLLDRRARAHVRSFDVIHTHSPFVTGWMGVRLARRFGIPLVFTYHTQLEEYAHYVPFEQKATRRAATTLTRTYANLAGTVIVPTSAMEARLRGMGVTTPIAVIPTGIDAERFATGRRSESLRERLGATKLILLVSRLAREKNIDLAIRALGGLEDSVHLVLAGDGPERAALGEAAQSAGVEGRVHFLGHVPREELPDLYASCDAFVFPSLTETQGLVLAEALVAGLPVVAVDTPQSRDVLEGHGLLVSPRSDAVACGLREALRMRLDQSAAHLALKRFSLRLQADRTIEIYRGLLAERRTA
jgi:1,2-diacylglycerol 3-alpha-glucosyltransferase